MAEPIYEPEVEPTASEVEPEAEAEATAEPESEYLAETEPEAETSPGMLYANVVIYSLIIFLILLLNAIILAAIFKARLAKRNAINIYLLSLIVSRMSIGVLVVPARITGLYSEAYLGSFLCKICHYFALGSSAASVCSTTSIAIVKFQEIVLKKGVIQITTKRALRDVLIIWIVGHLYAIRAPIMNDLTVVKGRIGCTVVEDQITTNKYFVFVDFVLLFLTPMTIVSYCYIKIVLQLSNGPKDKEPPSPQAVNIQVKSLSRDVMLDKDKTMKDVAPEPEPAKPPTADSDVQRKNSINMILTVTTLFIVCTIMSYIPKLYSYWEDDLMDDFSLFETICYQISYSNAWINAIVILIFRRDIRNPIKDFCDCTAKIWPGQRK